MTWIVHLSPRRGSRLSSGQRVRLPPSGVLRHSCMSYLQVTKAQKSAVFPEIVQQYTLVTIEVPQVSYIQSVQEGKHEYWHSRFRQRGAGCCSGTHSRRT